MISAIVTNVSGNDNPNFVIDMTPEQYKNNEGKIIARTSLPEGKYIVWVNVDVWALTLQMDDISRQFPLHYHATLESNSKIIKRFTGDLLQTNSHTNGMVNFHVETASDSSQTLELKFWGNINNCLVVRDVKVTALRVDELTVLNEKPPLQKGSMARRLSDLANQFYKIKLVKNG